MDLSSSLQTQSTPKKRSKLLWIFIFLVLLSGLGYAGIPLIAAIQLTTPKRTFVEPTGVSKTYQAVSFPAREDKLRLHGWYFPAPLQNPALILVHGKDSSRTKELYDHFLEFATALSKQGFSVLMFDLRGHGQSQDAHFSFGVYEKRDVLGAYDFLAAQGFPPGNIGLWGVSMGAASSLFAAAEEPGIGAIVLDCGYAEIDSIIKQEWPKESHLPNFLLAPTEFWVKTLYHYDLAHIRPVDSISKLSPRPTLIIHGDNDQLIDYHHGEQLHAAYPSSTLWIVKGAKHAGSYQSNPSKYEQKVGQFFKDHLWK